MQSNQEGCPWRTEFGTRSLSIYSSQGSIFIKEQRSVPPLKKVINLGCYGMNYNVMRKVKSQRQTMNFLACTQKLPKKILQPTFFFISRLVYIL